MMRKTILAIVAALSLGTGAVAVSTPAEAGFWYHGGFVTTDHGWEHYRCHFEVRRTEYWHPHRWVRERVRVCD